MLGYLRHHPTPSAGRGTEHNADTPPRPTAVTGPAGAARGRMIAGSLRPFTTGASHHASAERANKMVKAPPGRCRQDRIAAGRFSGDELLDKPKPF